VEAGLDVEHRETAARPVGSALNWHGSRSRNYSCRIRPLISMPSSPASVPP
jgi:hypothetical protein